MGEEGCQCLLLLGEEGCQCLLLLREDSDERSDDVGDLGDGLLVVLLDLEELLLVELVGRCGGILEQRKYIYFPSEDENDWWLAEKMMRFVIINLLFL